MISVSQEYKEIMLRPIRNRAYISVGIGIVNQSAQGGAKASGDFAYWSNGNVFNTNKDRQEYATLEQNRTKADGSMLFPPENDELMQLADNGLITNELLGQIRVDFGSTYAIKGITIDFGASYPTKFEITTVEKTLTYENAVEKFSTTDVLGDTDYIVIKPISMIGGQQRLHIKSILMGVGLNYVNSQTKSFSLNESTSPISAELPSKDISYSFYDEENRFNVDDDNSFIDYLETMQKLTISFGLELDSGDVEWHQIAATYLKDWKSQKGIVSISATDRLSQMEDNYTLGNKIYDRTAYQEAESILQDAGLQPDEYFIDEYLNDVQLHNPMPENSHKECLQLLANACRCVLRENEDGKVMLKANFAIVIDPEELTISTNSQSEWSKVNNIIVGSEIEYADLTSDFFRMDGTQYFMPEDQDYLETGFVSGEISDIFGKFQENPIVTIKLPASYTYFGINVNFGGNPPEEVVVHTYNNSENIENVKFYGLKKESFLFHEFLNFDEISIEVIKTKPNNRVLIQKVAFGDLSDYVLTRTNMLENPIGYKEKRVKEVDVKIYTFTNDEEGNAKEVEDNVFFKKAIGEVGEIKTVSNPLVSTQEHAELIADWVGNYFSNNISYSVKYRGEPRLSASDIIHMESQKKSNLQVEITNQKLSFNGAFSGELEMRRALKTSEVL